MDSTLIDVVIATLFFFVSLSLIIATINEFLGRVMKLRTKNFKAGLKELVGDDLAAKIISGNFAPPSSRGTVDHIEPRQFALAIAETVNDLTDVGAIEDADIPESLKDRLKTFRKAAESRLKDIHKEIEDWFDSSMGEVAVWFRKQAQWITRILAVILVLALNADTITVVDRAWKDRALRESLVGAAAAAAEKSPTAGADKSIGAIKKDVEAQLDQFPIGWWSQEKLDAADYPLKALGLLITYIALCLGAPFWFDVLKRVMQLKSQIQTLQRKKAGG